jgi:hypothetical protein
MAVPADPLSVLVVIVSGKRRQVSMQKSLCSVEFLHLISNFIISDKESALLDR